MWAPERAGGYFFGTVASGRRVQDIMWKSGQWPKLRLPLLALDARWVGDAAPFGCAYNCAIGDTVTQGAAPPSTPYSLPGLTLFCAMKQRRIVQL